MNGSKPVTCDGDISSRLAVIENRLQTLIDEVMAIREYVPVKMVEHNERIGVVERHIRTLQRACGVFASTTIGAFIAHVFGR